MTVLSPTVSRSGHAGTFLEKMTTPLPIFAPRQPQVHHKER